GNIKLTVLGSGTCVPNGERNSSGYFLETHSARFMLDCGAGTVHALARYRVPWETMTHLIVSHFHVDHIGEMPSLMLAFRHGMTGPRTDPLEIIGPRGFAQLMENLKTAFGSKLLELPFPIRIREIEPDCSVNFGKDLQVSFARTPHTSESV